MIENNRKRRSRMYYALFRMRFIAGLQYRAAAAAGIVTQFAWGGLNLLMYKAFYEVNPAVFPMEFQALSTYVWLQQALLALFMGWFFENDIFQMIVDGQIAYELCRPMELYQMWFFRSMANRLSKAVLRCMPILLFAALLPRPYGITLPAGGIAAIWFVITTVLGFLVVVAFGMLVYISAFFTISSSGIKIISTSLGEFLSGAVVPLPFMPDGIRQAVEMLPFASMQNVPLRIYSGDIAGNEILYRAGLQLFWAAVLILLGQVLIRTALKRVVVQGG